MLKDIDLKNLGIKNKNIKNILDDAIAAKTIQEEMAFDDESSSSFAKKKRSYTPYHSELNYNFAGNQINDSPNMNNKFLKYVNIIENIKDNIGQYFDKRVGWEKDLESAEFTLPSKPSEKAVPLTFRKFFYQTFPKNITEFALKNPEKLPNLVTKIRQDIQKDAQSWLDFVADKQISNFLCQIDNYSQKGRIYKKSNEFQNIVGVIQWIIDTNTKLLYESTDWNKDKEKTFSEEKGNLLIIDTTLHKEIKIEEERMKDFRYKDKYKENPKIFPLPLYGVWENFSAVIVCPLKNNFQFIIIDKRALIGWQDFQKLEIKYDEDNLTTYFCRKMEGGFKQLTCYNAIAFIGKVA